MDAEKAVTIEREGQALEEFAVLADQDAARPLGGDARVNVEPGDLRPAACRGVVIAEKDGLATGSNQIQTLVRARAVADDVAEADDPVGCVGVDDREDRLERLEIAVNVGQENGGHPAEGRSSWAIRSRIPFTKEPDFGVTSVNYHLASLLAGGSPPA